MLKLPIIFDAKYMYSRRGTTCQTHKVPKNTAANVVFCALNSGGIVSSRMFMDSENDIHIHVNPKITGRAVHNPKSLGVVSILSVSTEVFFLSKVSSSLMSFGSFLD
jgi:hypothetical protein